MSTPIVEVDEELAAAVRWTSKLRTGFYLVVLLVALAGQVTGAVERLHLPWYLALPGVAALELGGMVVLSNADVRRRLGERAVGSRLLSAVIAVFATVFNWLSHADHLLGAFYAGMSALGYLVWLMSTENNRRDRLRAKGQLPPTAPVYPAAQWIRHPWLTSQARHLALRTPELGLYGSLEAAAAAKRTARRQAAIAAVLGRKLRRAVDADTAEIATTVYDLDEIAARLASTADYAGLTAVIAADLNPARLLGEVSTVDAPGSGTRTTEPAPLVLAAHLPALVYDEVRRDLPPGPSQPWPREKPKAATKPRTGARRSPNGGRGRRAGGTETPRRPAEEARAQIAAARAAQPDISQAALGRLLGVTATRIRQLDKPINGTPVGTT